MIVLLIVKLLCDFSYYFLFGNYLGSFAGVNYSLWLTLAALVAAGVLSALLEKKGILRLLPPALSLCLLLQCRGFIDVIVLLPPIAYLWAVCIYRRYWPDGDEYKDVFSIQWKTLIILPFILVLTSNLTAMQQNCLPMVVVFLTTAILSLRMMRHSNAVLNTPRFQVQNALTVAFVAFAAWALSTEAFAVILSAAAGIVGQVLSPVINAFAWLLSNGIALIVQAFMFLLDMLRRLTGNEMQEKPKIKDPDQMKEEVQMEQDVPPSSETFTAVLIVLIIIVGLIAAFIIFKKLLGKRRRNGEGNSFAQNSITLTSSKKERDPLLAPKEPRAAVRWHYKKFLKYLKSKKVHLTRFYNSEQINALASRDGVAELSETEPLRELYITARYSDNPVTENDAKQAKELVKRIKDSE